MHLLIIAAALCLLLYAPGRFLLSSRALDGATPGSRLLVMLAHAGTVMQGIEDASSPHVPPAASREKVGSSALNWSKIR